MISIHGPAISIGMTHGPAISIGMARWPAISIGMTHGPAISIGPARWPAPERADPCVGPPSLFNIQPSTFNLSP
jgi:hypothetical protein